MDSPFVPVWIIVKASHNNSLNQGSTVSAQSKRRGVSREVLWTQEMKQLYVSSCWRQEGLHEESSAESWQRAHQGFHNQCIGLCLMRAKCNPSLTTYLSPAQRSIDDYFQETVWAREPLLFVDVVAYAPFERGVYFYASDIDLPEWYMFFKPTISSAQRGLDSPLHGQSGLHGTVRDELARWVAMRQANGEQVSAAPAASAAPPPPPSPRRAANELDYVIFKYQRIQHITFKGTNEVKSLTAFCKCHADCTRTRSLQKFGGLDQVRIMMKQWLLTPHFGFASNESGELGTKRSHMDLPDVAWFPFDEAGLDDQTVNVEDLDNPILNED